MAYEFYCSHANLQQKELLWLTFFGPEVVSETPEKLPLRSPKMSLLDHCDVYVRDELANWSLSGKGQLISLHYLDFPYMHRCPGHGWVPLLGWAVVCLLNGPSCTSGSSSGLLVFMPITLHYLYRETLKPAALNVSHNRNLSQTFPV